MMVPFELECCGRLVHACCLVVHLEGKCKACGDRISGHDKILAAERPVTKMPAAHSQDSPELLQYWKGKRMWLL